MSDSSVFAALGSVLGYVGAEAATKQVFERLLWPQRANSNFTLGSAPMLALLLPMGGPLHKASLEALDVLFSHGLFKGPRAGHMLGTAFFPKLGWNYTIWGENGEEVKTEELRNGLWIRAIRHIPIPTMGQADSNRASSGSAEKGSAETAPLRAMVTVSHLTLAKATDHDKASSLPFVSEEVKMPNIRTFAAICVAESTAIFVAVGLAIDYRSLWAIWWLAPLFLRLLSALFAPDRQAVLPLEPDVLNEQSYDFEVHCPQSEGNFILITGPRLVVDQFFVHYGHPVRNRARELVQLVIVVMLGAVFPFGLFCSVIWMSIEVQYVWLCYQLYVVLATLVARYCYSGNGTTTEARIAKHLSREPNAKNPDDDHAETSILFGQERNGSGTIKASLTVTYHNRYLKGKACMDRLLRRSPE